MGAANSICHLQIRRTGGDLGSPRPPYFSGDIEPTVVTAQDVGKNASGAVADKKHFRHSGMPSHHRSFPNPYNVIDVSSKSFCAELVPM